MLVPQARLQPQSPDFADTGLIGGLGISKTQGFADNIYRALTIRTGFGAYSAVLILARLRNTGLLFWILSGLGSRVELLREPSDGLGLRVRAGIESLADFERGSRAPGQGLQGG